MKATNLLPFDGEALNFGAVFTLAESEHYLNALTESIAWQPDKVKIFGKLITTKRKVAWHGSAPYTYKYSHITRVALPWTKELKDIKSKVEKLVGCEFNSCLLNYYADGNEGMGWHSDNEKELCKNAPIASVSFGATRKFIFKHKQTPEKVSLILESGSLLVMKPPLQEHWRHSLPMSKLVKAPRINLTFRVIESDLV